MPADDDQPWSSNPFELTVRDGYMYGRGVDDDKGHITARLTAVQKYRREFGDFPVNIIFIMEGSEESASVGLETYLENTLMSSVARIYWCGSKVFQMPKVRLKFLVEQKVLSPLI